MRTTTETSEAISDEMRPNEAAKYAGLCRPYLFALLKHEVIPSRYERGRRIVRRADLDAFLAEKSIRTS